MVMSERDLPRRKKVEMARGRRLPGGKLIPLKTYQDLGRETTPLPMEITPADSSWETEVRSLSNWLNSYKPESDYQNTNKEDLADQLEKNSDFYMNFFEAAKEKYLGHNPLPFSEITASPESDLFGPITRKILADVVRVEKVRAKLS
jgi:hypothetical protein